MAQLNLQLTKKFLADLKRYMQLSGIRTKSEAIRTAVERSLLELTAKKKRTEFRGWLGIGLRTTPRKVVRFKDEDDLWQDK